MEQEKLDRLTNILIESKFTCMPRGTFKTKEIYEVVKKNYPEFCNDDFLCIHHKEGTKQPEWKHRVRGVLTNLKDRSDRVQKSGNFGEWDFIGINSTNPGGTKMEQEKLNRLAKILNESEFTCMPRGTFNTKEIYEVVKKNYPEFCNDDFLCIHHKKGGNQPEWKHRVRGVLTNLNNKSDRVRKSGNHGEWDFI